MTTEPVTSEHPTPTVPTTPDPMSAEPVDDHTHGGVGDPTVHHTPEQIRREMRVYMYVFGGLIVGTIATVVACYGFDLPVHVAIAVALAIALTKGFLVAGFFMHLLSEKKVIYSVLAITAFFFALLIWLPLHDIADKMGH